MPPRVVSLLHGSWILLWSDIDPNGLICWRMARRVTEKGIQAERWQIHLGFINGLRGDELFRYARNAARQTDSDLVAEPMARHRECPSCRTIWWAICRHLLVAACLMAGCIMILDHAFLEPTVGIRNVTLDEPNHFETTTVSAELETTTLQAVEIEEPDTFRAVFSVDFTGATQRVVNVALTTGEATLRKTNDAAVDLQRELLAHKVLQHVQLALEQYNQHGGALVGNGVPDDTLTSDYGSDNRRLQVVDTPYRQAMQSKQPRCSITIKCVAKVQTASFAFWIDNR